MRLRRCVRALDGDMRGRGADVGWPVVQGKIVRQESANIDANFERKKKQVEIEKKMCGRLASPRCGPGADGHACAAPSRTRTTSRVCDSSSCVRSYSRWSLRMREPGWARRRATRRSTPSCSRGSFSRYVLALSPTSPALPSHFFSGCPLCRLTPTSLPSSHDVHTADLS